MRHRSSWILLFALLLAPAFAARADGPPTAADLAETREVKWLDPDEPDLRAKATELGSAAGIYEFVRNELDFVLYDGSRSNATNTFLNRRGNDVDLASVLIAMLRSQGIPARYVTGVVSVSFAELTNWLEIPNVTRAASTLIRAGFQNVSNAGGRTSFTHAWVKALVPLARYRGNDAESPVDCMATPAACTWVHLDPSFKQRRYRDPAELVDISNTVVFDYESYYRAEEPSYPQPDGLDRREKNPLEIYEEMILQHLHTTPGLEGKTLEDVVYEGEIVPERHGILPTSAPFRFDPAAVTTYASVDAHDADAAHVDWTKTVSFTVSFPKHLELESLTLSGGAPVPLSALADQNLIVAYESSDFDNPATPKTLVARLGDQLHATLFTLVGTTFTWSGGSVSLSQPLDVDTPFDVALTMQGNGTLPVLDAVYPDLSLGGHFLVATGGAFSGFAEVRRSARRLLDAVEQSPVLEGSGTLYVDQNANGTIDPGEPTLLEDAATQRRLTGGVLAIARDLYYAQVRSQLERLTKLQRTTMPPSGFLGVVSSVHDVRAVDGTAFSLTPVGLLVDMKAITVTTPYKIDQTSTQNPGAFRLGGHIISSLEHEIWQEITGFEAISTMKGIQRTKRDGGLLMELDEGQTQVTIAQALTNWGFGQTLPTGITWRPILHLFSHDLRLPSTTSDAFTKTLSVIRETVGAGESDLEKRGWDLEIFLKFDGAGNVYGSEFESLFRLVYDNYALFQSSPSGTPLQPPHNLAVSLLGFSIPGCATYTTTGQALAGYPGCFAALMDRPELETYSDYLDFFDESQGFAVADHLYRDTDPARHIRAAALAPLRNELVLGADEDKDGIPDGDNTIEVVIPSIVADGELLDFGVWIERYLDAAGFEFSTGYIINRAGGGYVSGAGTTIPALDLFGYNNSVFTDQSLASSVNNSVFAPSTFDPIATVTGNVFHDETDLRIKGRDGLDYVFTRSYNSGPTRADQLGVPLGHKWTHSYNVRLIANDHGTEPNADVTENLDFAVSSITYVDERGGEHVYGVSGTGPIAGWTVTNPRGNFDTLDLSQGASNTYTLRFRNGTEYVFGSADLSAIDQTARLEAIRDPYGNELTLGYTAGRLTSIQDNLGVTGRTGLTLSYLPDGRLQQVADWTGRTWSYSYDPSGNLATATDPLGHTTRYAYTAGPTGAATHLESGARISPQIINTAVVGADLDGDGDRDALAGGNQGLKWHANLDGKGTFGGPTLIANWPAARGIRPADLDNDGDTDVLVFSSSTASGYEINWYENVDGSGAFAPAQLIAIDDLGINDVVVANLDGDSDLDVATVSSFDAPGRVAWYRNQGGGAFSNRITIATTSGATPSGVDASDLDGDSDRDLVVTYSNGRSIVWYRNNGSGSFAAPTTIADTDPQEPNSVVAADLDGDGDRDVVATSYVDAAVFWYENLGSGSFGPQRAITAQAGRATAVIATDVDGDGDPDLLAQLEQPYRLLWLENAGDGSFQIRKTVSEPLALDATDIDGDGDPDILAAMQTLGLVWLENFGTQETDLLASVIQPEDRDGDLVGDVETTFDYYENGRGFLNANSFGQGERLEYDLFRKRTRITNPRGFVSAHFYDANGELTKLTQPDGGISTFRHNADGRRWERTEPLGFKAQYSYCAARTLDGCASDAGGNLTLERDPLGSTVEYDYELTLFDQITRRKDENNAEHLSVYYTADDPGSGAVRGKLHQRRIAELGSFTNVLLQELIYNPNGTVDEQVDYLDPADPTRKRTTTFSYTGNGLNVSEIHVTGSDGTSRRRTFTHDALGRVKTETLWRRTSPMNPTPIPLTTTFDYDAADRVIRVTDPLGSKTETDYDDNGNVTQIRFIGVDPQTGTPQPTRVVERRTYDDADRLIEVRDVFDAVTTFAYDESGNRTQVTDPTGVTRRLEYDARNRLIAVTDENGHRSEMRYDLDGRLVAEIDPNGEETRLSYDAAGRLVSRTDPLGNLTTFRVDGVGNRVGQTDPNANADPGNQSLVNANGESLTQEYDELGRLVRGIDAQDHVTQHEYNLLGNRTKVTDAKGQVTKLVHDDLGRLVRVVDPVIETPVDAQQTFAIDEAGNVIAAVDRKGQVVLTTYDALNRPVQRTWQSSGETETLAYDAFGNLKQIASSEVTYTFGYDAKNRLTSKLDGRLGRSLSFEYDAADRLIEKTDYQGDVTRFLYDGTGRLVAEQSDAYLQVSYHFDPAGRLLNRILSNGAQTDYAYNAAGRLTSLTQRAADGTVVTSSVFSHDANGNILSDAGGVYTYDALNRLLSANLAGTANDRAYTYDPVGNRDTQTVGVESLDYIYGAGNRLLEIRRISNGSLVHRFEYDANGAVVAKKNAAGSPIYTLTRDDRGRVVSATGPGFANAFGYDPKGIRVRRNDSGGSHLFHLEGDRLEAVYSTGGALREKYLRGSVIDEVVNAYLFDGNGKPTNLSYHHDPVTSVVALTGHAGTLEETVLYAPFGEELATTGSSANTLRFTGRERDPDTGLYYFRARYYDAAIGRFLSEDPLGLDGGDVNFYAYAGNNPLLANDPTGRCPFCLTAGIGALIGAGGGALSAIAQGADFNHVLLAAGTGAIAGGLIGTGIGALANSAAVATSVAAFNADILGFGGALALGGSIEAAGAIVASGVSGYTSSVIEQTLLGPGTISQNFSNVDYSLAQDYGIAGAVAGVLPAVIPAASTTAPFAITTTGEAFLGVAQEQIAFGTGILASELLINDPYSGPPADFNPTFSFPSSDPYSPIYEVYCSPKCF